MNYQAFTNDSLTMMYEATPKPSMAVRPRLSATLADAFWRWWRADHETCPTARGRAAQRS
jgi:hypothetical protein